MTRDSARIRLLAEFLRKPDAKSARRADIAEPIGILILDDFPDKFRTVNTEPFRRLIEAIHREHDAEIAHGVDRAFR